MKYFFESIFAISLSDKWYVPVVSFVLCASNYDALNMLNDE